MMDYYTAYENTIFKYNMEKILNERDTNIIWYK